MRGCRSIDGIHVDRHQPAAARRQRAEDAEHPALFLGLGVERDQAGCGGIDQARPTREHGEADIEHPRLRGEAHEEQVLRNVSTLLEQNGKLAAAEKRPSARARLLWALPALALGAVAFLLVTERSRGPAQPGPQLEVVTPDEMRQIDAAASEPVEELIERAGAAVARAAVRMLGGSYGKRVVVVAGKGNNGEDGRVAAATLESWGASVRVIDAAGAHCEFVDDRVADLMIDAAYGIGFRGTWAPPIVLDVPVLAVDIPSGLDPATGCVNGGVLVADRTVTFAAPKLGMVLGDGPSVCGAIDVVDVGIAAGRPIVDLLIAGEHAVALQIFHHHAATSAAQGAPVHWIAMQPAFANLQTSSLLEKAPHPNAGKLLIDFLVSREGQELYAAADYLPVDPDVKITVSTSSARSRSTPW